MTQLEDVSTRLALLLLLSLCAVGVAHADSLSSAVFVRTDSDQTLVVSPRAHVDRHVSEATSVDVSYAADVWTSASIDVRASATVPVTEQRDELDLGVHHAWQDAMLGASYRFSVENDYVSHGATLNGSLDLAQHNTTLAAAGYAFMDTVGRSGQPTFSRGLLTVGGRASLLQVLDAQTLVQATYELTRLNGYQSSPYRFVGIGGTGIGCFGATECLPEHMPGTRNRHAFAVLARRALGESFAAAAGYRLYIDSWQLLSHTLSAELSWMPGSQTRFVLGYRFYTQSGVYFYQPVYMQYRGSLGFTTRDREQSPMHDQRIGLEWVQSVPLADASTRLRFHTSAGLLAFHYDDFRGLLDVRAVELTCALSLEY